MEESQGRKQAAAKGGEGAEEQLPTESSPYVKYKDLEEYKMKGYGTQGHQDPVDPPGGGGGGGTDAPTLSGSGLSQGKVDTVDSANRRGVP